jgi:hypothetical protein
MERHGDPKHQMRERSVIPVENSREWLHWEGGGREEERFHVAKLAFNISAAMKPGVLNQQSTINNQGIPSKCRFLQ